MITVWKATNIVRCWFCFLVTFCDVQQNSTRMGDAGHATQHVRHVMEVQRQDASPVHHHLFFRIHSAWLCAWMGHTWSRVYAHLVCIPVSAVCLVSTAHLVLLAFICRVASAELPVLLGKSIKHKEVASKVKEYIIIVVTRKRKVYTTLIKSCIIR